MVEFALVAPFFFILLFGVMEMGRLVWTNHELANGTREAARLVMVRGSEWNKTGTAATPADVKQRIIDTTTGLSEGALSIDIAPGLGGDPGTSVTITATYQYDVLIGIIPGLSDFTMSHASTVIIQH